jgi:hypothetical protein
MKVQEWEREFLIALETVAEHRGTSRQEAVKKLSFRATRRRDAGLN